MSSTGTLSTLNETKVVAAAKRGQTAAFDELWESHSKRILRTTYRITENREDAEDARQDSFLRAFLHFREFDGRARFSTWLTRIAINSALMILRKKQSLREVPIDDGRDHDGNQGYESVLCHAPDPEAHCAQHERERILRRAIGELRPTIRQVVELQKLQEYSLQDTAKVMGLSVGAAKTRLSRAKDALRRSLKRDALQRARHASVGRPVKERCIVGTSQPHPAVFAIERRSPWTPAW